MGTSEGFIAICFPLASLCGSMATFRSHPRHGAIIWLDRHAGLGRVGYDRSYVKGASDRARVRRGQRVKAAFTVTISALAHILPRRAAFIRQTTKRTEKDLRR